MTDKELEILVQHYNVSESRIIERFTHHFLTGRSFVDFGRNMSRLLRENQFANIQFIDPAVEGSERSFYHGTDLQPIQITRTVEISRDMIIEANRQFDAEFRHSMVQAWERIQESFGAMIFEGFQSRYPNRNQPRIPDNTEKAGPAEKSWKDWLKESAHKQEMGKCFRK